MQKLDFFINKNQIKILLLIFVIAYTIRSLIYYFYASYIYLPDSNNYIAEAIQLLAFDYKNKLNMFEITMPGYSLLMCIPTLIEIFISPLINFNNLFSVLSVNDYNNEYIYSIKNKAFVIDNVFSSAIPIIIYLISNEIFKDKIVSIIALLASCLYPVSIFYSIAILTENFFMFFLLIGIYFFLKKKYYLSYFLFVVTILIRPTFELAIPVVILFHFIIFDRKKLFSNLFVYILIYIILMSPWWCFNYIKYDSFVRLHPTVGFMLYSGNNELNKTGGGIINSDFKIDNMKERKRINPILFDNVLKKKAFEYIINNKIIFVKNSFVKFKRLYSFKLFTDKYSESFFGYIYMISYIFLFSLFILSFFYIPRHKYKYLIVFIILSLFLTMVHSITISSIRYRYPIELFMIIFSSYSFRSMLKKYF